MRIKSKQDEISPTPADLPLDKMRSVYEYKDYRHFVRDFYLFSKARNKKFSHRFFARLAGFKSSNFIKFIIDNKSNMSSESAEQIARAMKLTQNETLFFTTLVLFNQSKNTEERHQYATALLKFQQLKKVYPLREQVFNYTSKWYFSLLRGIVGLAKFREDLKWLAQKIAPELSHSEIRKGFEDLISIGLLERDASGKLKQTHAHVATDDEVAVSSVAQFHRDMMKRASESIDRFPREKRDISGVTVGVSRETAQKIKEKVQNFRKEIVDLAAQENPLETNALYQLNIQLFPLFELDDEDKNNE